MTQFAKMLVFIQVALSILFTGWAVALYTQRIEWAQARTLGGDPIPERPGRLAYLRNEITDLDAKREQAERRYLLYLPQVGQAEKHRFRYLDWYAETVKITEDGENAPKAKDKDGVEVSVPVRRLLRTPETGEFDMEKIEAVTPPSEFDKDGKPTKEAPLAHVTFYTEKIEKLRKEVTEQQQELARLIAKHKELTAEISGLWDKDEKGNDRLVKDGLQQKRDAQIKYLNNCLDEQQYLKPLVDNSEAELVMLQLRHTALEKRLKELEKVTARR